MNVLTAYTLEIDDPDVAVSEILEQLDLEHNLLANSVGVISLYPEFIDTGVVRALSEALPFDIVGATTLSSAVPSVHSELMLALTVLTSDDCQFAAALTASLKDSLDPIADAYNEAGSKLPGKTALVLAYAPLMFNYAGDQFVERLSAVSGSAPVFGTVAVDASKGYAQSAVIHGGHTANDALAMVLVSGDISPVFTIASIAPNKIRKQTSIITAADGNILKEVNDMPLAAYLEKLGLAKDGEIFAGINSIPFLIDVGDGSVPVARAIFSITPEGYGICGGIMPEGSTLSIGGIDKQDVLMTTLGLVDEALSKPINGLLMFSCIGRNAALGMDTFAELMAVEERIAGSGLPYMLSYSGGEICPLASGGGLINNFHNNTVIALVI